MFVINMNAQDEFHYTRLANTKKQVLAIVQNEIHDYLSNGALCVKEDILRLKKVWNDVDSLVEEWNEMFSLEFEIHEEEPNVKLKQLKFEDVFSF